jgi:hypothetical protein
MLTVGVAPGTYTLGLGGDAGPGVPIDPNCPLDEISTGAHGVPMIGWYTMPPIADVNPYTMVSAAVPPPAGPTATVAPLNPYGTQSTLKGSLADTMTIAGIRVDILAGVAAAILGLGLIVHYVAAKPKRKR